VAIDRCVVLAGGTGGAKLAAGLQDVLGDGLAVVANTADDVEVLGIHVSPDPDLVTYWLSDQIDEQRGWGIRDDGFTVFDRPSPSSRTATSPPASTAPASSPRAAASPPRRTRSRPGWVRARGCCR